MVDLLHGVWSLWLADAGPPYLPPPQLSADHPRHFYPISLAPMQSAPVKFLGVSFIRPHRDKFATRYFFLVLARHKNNRLHPAEFLYSTFWVIPHDSHGNSHLVLLYNEYQWLLKY
jgi:hypothetical protein